MIVKAAAALAAEPAGGHQFGQARRNLHGIVPRQNLRDCEADVESHRIGQTERSHRHAEIGGGPIDHGRLDPFADQGDGLEQIRHEDAVD